MTETVGISIVDPGDRGMVAELGGAIRQALVDQGQSVAVSPEWLGAKAAESINTALGEIDFFDTLGAAWATVGALRERADPEKYPPGKANYVKLGQHTVNFDVSPSVVVALGPWSSQPIALVMSLSAILNAMELKIRSGHIESVAGGSCDLGVTVKLGGRELMKRRTLKTFTLDVEHRFKPPGIDLLTGRPGAAAAPARDPAVIDEPAPAGA